jgi:flagellar protein FliS
MSPNASNYHAYRRAAYTVSKSRQIVMLYDGVVSTLQQAQSAMLERRIEDRYNLLAKASQIIMGLQGSLDFEAGQEVAATLYDFYSHLLFDINQLHRTNNGEHCQQLINEIKSMRAIWAEIDSNELTSASTEESAPSLPLDSAVIVEEASEEPPALPPSGLSVSA